MTAEQTPQQVTYEQIHQLIAAGKLEEAQPLIDQMNAQTRATMEASGGNGGLTFTAAQSFSPPVRYQPLGILERIKGEPHTP